MIKKFLKFVIGAILIVGIPWLIIANFLTFLAIIGFIILAIIVFVIWQVIFSKDWDKDSILEKARNKTFTESLSKEEDDF